MHSRLLLTLLGAAIIVPTLAAWPAPQGDDMGMGGGNDSGPGRATTLTPIQEFARRLKLDAATQGPAVNEILREASLAAAPVGREMLLIRQTLVNAELAGDDDEKRTALDAYTAAAAKMVGLEATAFAKIYAMLKPNQQTNAAHAFAFLAGIFQPAAPTAGGRGAGRGGARGGRQ
jgi:hypothetical protein